MMSENPWINGTSPQVIQSLQSSAEKYTMQNPDQDKEVRPEVVSMTTNVYSPDTK